MKKRILAICLVVAMAATAIVGASMAYLTDTDEAVNVMTLGNVQIEQKEQDREGNDFVQGQTLLPYVTLGTTVKEPVTVNGYTIQMRTKASVGNYMDKIVTVTNTGKTDAYVRTLIAIPAALENNESASNNILHWNAVSNTDTNPNNGWMWDIENNKEWDAPVYATIEVDGVKYNVYVATNKNVIKAGESTAPSLVGIYLDSKVDFDGINYTYDGTVIDGFDGQVNVLVLSQAVQAAGFADAATALDTAFPYGENNANLIAWFEGTSIPTVVSSAEELVAALAAGEDVVLTEDVTVDANTAITVASGKDVTLNLNGHKITATANKTGNQELFLVKGNMTVENGILTLTATNNQGWNAMATLFDVTAGGVLNMNGVTANVSGTDMNFVVHLNNWGSATLNVEDCDFTTTYCAVRVFNSGNDMNNVTITNTDFHNGRAFWVHNYTSEGKNDTTLNLDIYNNGNTSDNAKPVRFGFSDSTYYDLIGNQITNS